MRYILFMIVGAILVGCSSTARMDTTVVEGDADNAKILYNSSVIGKSIKVVEVNTGRTDNGIYRVQAVVKSQNKEAQTIQYKYEWIDDQGLQVGSSPWKVMTIYGSAVANLPGVANSTAATNYRLLISEYK